MKRILLVFALLSTPYAVAQEPRPSVSAPPSTTKVVAGADLVSNGVSQTPAYQAKAVLNVREFGVTCSGTTDDTTAMQNAINAACNTGGRGKTLVLPNSCTIKLTGRLNVTKCSGITVDGGQSQGEATIGAAGGAGAGNAALLWYGLAGGTVLEINQTRDSVFKNLTVFANASGYMASGANIGILIDEIAPVTNIVTNNHFDNIQVVNYAANSSFIGIDICPTAPGNCEAQNFDRLFLTCGGGTPTATSNGTGIKYDVVGGAEPYYEYIHWIEYTGCSKGIDIEGGFNIDIDGGLAGRNYTDLLVNAGALIRYANFRSENAIAQIVVGNSSFSSLRDLTIESNSFSGLTNGTTTITYPYNTTGGILRLIKNAWDVNSTVTPFGPSGSGAFVGVLDSQDNTYPNNVKCISTAFVSSGTMYSSLNDQPTGGTCNYGGMHLGRPTGSLRIDPTAFGNLPTCASPMQGMLKPVSDSKTDMWGATITGGGSDHVLAYCDGTHWTVAGK
jgi:hypothetical protein